jgi:hypothetical protein
MAAGSRSRPEAAGNGVWDLRPWCDQFGIAISTYYTLKDRPRSTRVGRLLKIIESPADYARRIAEMQQHAEAA